MSKSRQKRSPEEKKREEKEKRLYKTYGLTLREWDIIFNKQDGVCFICKTMPPNRILCVDHVHIKGFKKMKPDEKKKYVRGLLCYMCNTGIKCVEKTADGKRNRQQLEGMVRYFNKYKLKGE